MDIFIIYQKKKLIQKKNEKTGNITGYYIDDVHLIIDKYYGEFYNENMTIQEVARDAHKYAFGCVFVSFGKFTRYSSVELHTANCTAGEFMRMGGSTFANEISNKKGYKYDQCI